MRWRHILAAGDAAPAGLHAIRVARDLAASAGVRCSAVTVLPPGAGEQVPDALAEHEPVVAHGVPGIEIVRVAEETGADLIVLGRTIHGDPDGLRLGSTADQVARRSRVPCLFVPEAQDCFCDHLVALDGTDRGYAVLETAQAFLGLVSGRITVVTVEPAAADGAIPHARSMRVARKLDELGRGEAGRPKIPLTVLRGDPVEAIRGALDAARAGLLVLGARRGGPGGPPVGTGVGRMLLSSAQSAVLTVPL